jgi:hypothetical protein
MSKTNGVPEGLSKVRIGYGKHIDTTVLQHSYNSRTSQLRQQNGPDEQCLKGHKMLLPRYQNHAATAPKPTLLLRLLPCHATVAEALPDHAMSHGQLRDAS